MMLFTHVQTAIRQLLSNKGKSVLTMLGIVIGIGSVILIMTLGEIAKGFLLGQITQFGTNVVEVADQGSFGPFEDSEPIIFTLEDVEQLEASSLLPEIQGVSTTYTIATSAEYEGEQYAASIWGDRPDVFDINNLTMLAGKGFTDNDMNQTNRVAVLSEGFAKDVFGDAASSVGKNLNVDGRSFFVIGVVQDPPLGGGPFGSNYIYIPLTTAYQYLAPAEDYNKITFLLVEIDPEADVALFKDKFVFEIKRIKNLDDAETKRLYVESREQFLAIFDNVLIGIQMFVAAIAAISLFVGGIGIMNIMLVTVKERTKEIGLRKAVGAKNSSILVQFLIEAAVLTTVGGLIGITGGLGLAYVAVIVVNAVQPTWGIAFVFVPLAIGLACGVSTVTGLIFGLYPAMKAARLHPIDALRYE